MIICEFYGKIKEAIKSYKFDKRIEMIKELIQKGKNEQNKIEYEEFDEKISEIDKTNAKYNEEIYDNYFFTAEQLNDIEITYEMNKDKSNIHNIYEKLVNGVINKLSETYINYEKQLISLNEKIIDIFNKINKNF